MQHQHFKGYPKETPLPDPVKEIERRRGIMTENTFRSNMEIAGYPIHPLTWETVRLANADILMARSLLSAGAREIIKRLCAASEAGEPITGIKIEGTDPNVPK